MASGILAFQAIVEFYGRL